MFQENQGQYLKFKDIGKQTTQEHRSHVFYTNRSIYTTTQNGRQFNSKGKPELKSHNQQIITPKSKYQYKKSPKSTRSNCEVISFSTESTKKQMQTPKQTKYNQKQNIVDIQLNHKNYQRSQKKASSDVKILKDREKYKKEENIANKIIEEVIQQIPLKYQMDFNASKNIPDQKEINHFVQTLKMYEAKIQRLQKEIMLKNNKITQLEKTNKQRVQQQCLVESFESFLKPQNQFLNEQNRQSVRRLLKMLQMTNEYKQFAEFGMDDKGITFLSEASKKNRTKIDEENVKLHQKQRKNHFCSCNKQFIPQPYLWVSESIYEYGRDFLKSRTDQSGMIKGFLSKSEYELLLYQLNKMWRERQKKIVNTITHEKNMEIQKLKRKYNIHSTNQLHSARNFSKH